MKRYQKILILLFLVSLTFRLFFAFQTPYYDYEGYFTIRQVESITSSGFPMYDDMLSYGGKSMAFSPLYYYILAFFNLFLPGFIVFKIIPNILAASILFPIYLIARKITGNINIALITAGVSGFIPLYIAQTYNTLSSYAVMFPLICLMIYFLIDPKPKYTKYYVLCSIVLALLGQFSFVFALSSILYILLLRIEHLKQDRIELELLLFSSFLIFWIQFLIYKEAFLQHGPLVIWQNIPQTLLGQYFTQTNIVTLVLTIGLIPLVFGVYVIFRYLFREKNRNIYFITSFGLVLAVALWLKLIALAAGLAFLGIILTLLFAKGLELFVNYLKKTKVPYLKAAFVLFIILFSITSILPSYFFAQQELKNAATSGEIEALEGLPLNQNETVLGTLRQGNLIASFGKKNVMDTHFLLTKDPLQRMQDIQTIYQTPFETKAIELLNQYEVDYIFVSKAVREEYDIISLSFEEDTDCFELIYNKETKLYKVKCNLQKIS